MKYILTALLSLSMTANHAQVTKTEVLTNRNIVDVVRAGLGKTTIISKINSSACRFDLSTTALIDLKKQGVPEEVINAMLEKGTAKQAVAEPVRANAAKTATAKAAPVPSLLSEVEYFDHGQNSARPMEKARATMAKGFFGTSYNFELPGESSAFRLSPKDSLSFLVSLSDAMGEPGGWFTLYRLNAKKGKRSATYSSASAKGTDIISFSCRKVAGGVFEILPSGTLAKGEYFFFAKASMLNNQNKAADVFAFGVD